MYSVKNLQVENQIAWKLTLPFILRPFLGESFYGYILRLDYINNFTSGTVMDMIKKYNTGRMSLNRPGLFSFGTIFDFEKLSKLTDVTVETIYSLTFVPALKRLFRLDSIYPQLVGYSKEFKICPICIKDHKLPLIHIIKNIDVCIEHKVFLINECSCGENIKLFSPSSRAYCCSYCGKPFENLKHNYIDTKSEAYKQQEFLFSAYQSILCNNTSFIDVNEDLSTGFEDRLQSISLRHGLEHGKFKKAFGYDASNMINGHGPSNLSLAHIVEILSKLGYTPEEFRDLQFDSRAKKVISANLRNEFKVEEHTCPNIYCKFFNKDTVGNVKNYGKKKHLSGKISIEEYCTECGTRFVGNSIIQSYDYNPGMRQYDIDKARERIVIWQKSLELVCEQMIEKRIPITLTGCFKKAKIPIGKTYFINRLGLISLIEKYAQKQRNGFLEWCNELHKLEADMFLRRIYKKKRNK